MRRSLTKLMLVLSCGCVALGAAFAGAIDAGTSAGAGILAAMASSTRTWSVTMAAAPDNLTLAQVSFDHAASGQASSEASLRVAVGAPFGDDYLAAAALRPAGSRIPRVLVLLVNRPSALLDPANVSVRLSAGSALGAPVVRTLANPVDRSLPARLPVLCGLSPHGDALSAADLRLLRSQGQALTGFGAASAVAQAYDLACGRPHAGSFARAVERAGSPTSPEPSPPVGKLPGEGCKPTPGHACPATSSDASASPALDG